MQPTQGLNRSHDLLRFSIPTFCPANGEQKPVHRHTREHRRTQTAAQGECGINDEQRKYKKKCKLKETTEVQMLRKETIQEEKFAHHLMFKSMSYMPSYVWVHKK